MKPVFAYFGGKARMADRIVELLPPHQVYMEPFFGSGAVLFAKRPARFEIVNDLDDSIVTFFRVLRERPDELEAVCALSPHARSEYQAADLDEQVEDLERARRFFVRITQSFGHAAGDQTGWSITTVRSAQAVPSSIRTKLGRFAAAAERLRHVSIECCPAVDLVERLATPETCIFVDPPYLASTRRGGRSERANDYRVDMGDDEAHRQLAKTLHATPAAVVLSGYPGELYEELYGDWQRFDFDVVASSSNALTVSRTGRVESVWVNRDVEDGRLDFKAAAHA